MVYEGELLVLDDPEDLRDPKTMFATAPRVDGHVRFESAASRRCTAASRPRPRHETLMYYGRSSRAGTSTSTPRCGLIEVGDERWPLDGFGWRDHSWGPRYWQVIWAYRLF